jgi:heterodisulfide reductase subunit C
MKSEDIRIPGTLPKREAILREAFLEQAKTIPGGEKIKACLQCATCSGSCPLSYAMDITPRKLIALFRAGEIEAILNSRTIWLCASCYTCQSRCPAGIKVTDIIYALKRTAMERKDLTKKYPVNKLSLSFIKSIYKAGRLNEARLLTKYFFKAGFWKAFSFIPLGFTMLKKHRLSFKTAKIKNIERFRKILNMAEKMDLPIERERLAPVGEIVGYKSIG